MMDKGVRSFTTWDMMRALVIGSVTRLSSFRELELALGIPRSTFGEALSKRSHGFFQDLCDRTSSQIRVSFQSELTIQKSGKSGG